MGDTVMGVCSWPPQSQPHSSSPTSLGVPRCRPSPNCPRAGTARTRLPDTPPTQDLGPLRDSGQLSRLSSLPTPKVLPPSFHICSVATPGGSPRQLLKRQESPKEHRKTSRPFAPWEKRSTNGLCSACQTLHTALREVQLISPSHSERHFQPLKDKPRGLKSTSLKHSPSEYNKEGQRSPKQAYPRPQWMNY